MLVAVALIPSFATNTRTRTLAELFVLNPVLYCAIAGLVLHVIQSPYRFLNVAPVMWLGRISYSLYLWQEPFFFSQTRPSVYKLLLGVGLACLSYYMIEQPVLRLRGRKTLPAETPLTEKMSA